MSTHIRTRIIAVLSLATIAVAAGTAMPFPAHKAANLGNKPAASAAPSIRQATPQPPSPRQAAASSTPCPTNAAGNTDVNVHATGPNSKIEVNCHTSFTTSSTSSASSTNVSVTNSSHQTSSGGHNLSSSSTNITITGQ